MAIKYICDQCGREIQAHYWQVQEVDVWPYHTIVDTVYRPRKTPILCSEACIGAHYAAEKKPAAPKES